MFKPQIVNNKNDESRPVRGHLLWQRRKKTEQGDEWVDEPNVSLSTMTAGSGLKLEMSTEELFLFTLAVRGLYGVYWNHGKQLPKTGEVFELADYATIAKSLDVVGNAAQIIGSLGQDGFVSLLNGLVTHGTSKELLAALPKLTPADLGKINALAGVGLLRQALDVWEANKGNADESFWQDTLAQYPFLFSQVFSTPVVVFGTKAYVGGKGLHAAGGKQPDFVLRNELTDHVLIVEIKTPATALLTASPYRPPDVYAVGREVCGAVAQVARYKDEFLINYGSLALNTDEKFLLADPRCLVVVGNTDQLDVKARRNSFEHFRRNQRNTEIITFDELFAKVAILLRLLEGEPASPGVGPTTT